MLALIDGLFRGIPQLDSLHPLFVHFPIAFLLAALVVMGLATVTMSREMQGTASWLLYLGTAGALAATATGWWSHGGIGPGTPSETTILSHRNIMLGVTAGAVLTSLVAFAFRAQDRFTVRLGLFIGLLAVCLAMLVGVDRGLELVYVRGVGVR